MKKLAALILCSFLVATTLRADVIWQELFNYTNGNIEVTSTNVVGGVLVTNWLVQSGTGKDAFVINHRLENAATGGTPVSRADDIHRNIPSAYTNLQPFYASFIINATNLPNAAGTYFAHFLQGSSTFQGKVFAVAGGLANTYRLGVSAAANTASVVFPNDLALNQDYQVVINWDPVNLYAMTIWVNPVSSGDVSLTSNDSVTPVAVTGFAFRQASSFGNWFCTISNLVLATTYDEAANNVVGGISTAPSIAYDLAPATNFVGSTLNLSVVAAGQGLADFVYQWQTNGVNIVNPNGNSNLLSIVNAQQSATANYSVIVSNTTAGTFAVSSIAYQLVTNGPPTITLQPTNQSVYVGKNLTLSVAALGTPPLSYAWTGASIGAANVDTTTTNTATLAINNFSTANTNGTYICTVSNPYGMTNTVAVKLTLLTPQVVTIDTLRGMVDPVFFLATNTTSYFTISNAVVYTLEVTNSSGAVNGGPFTGSANGEFFVKDSSGAGIEIFTSGGGATQPRLGDIITVTGPLSSFNGLLELNASTTDPSQSITVTGHTSSIPAPIVLPFTFTNGTFTTISNVFRKYVGNYIQLTNVYFAAYSSGAVFTGTSYILTNLSGDSFTLFLNSANTNVVGQPIPQFAASVSGVLGVFLSSTTATNRSTGFELDPFSYSNFVLATPTAPIPVAGVAFSGGAPVLTWTAASGFTYSILWSTNVAGPYTAIATGLTSGSYTDSVNTNLPASFYKISSP